jgi:hypothetical protein
VVYLEQGTLEGGRFAPNPDARVIAEMLRSWLSPIAERDGGWSRLFRDQDGAFWELTYPNSELQGGGPRRLELLSEEAARACYTFE